MPVQQWWWFVDPPGHGFVDPMGVFHAGHSGETSVVAECMMGVHLFNGSALYRHSGPDYWIQVMPPNASCQLGRFSIQRHPLQPHGRSCAGLTWEWWVTPPELGTVDSTGYFERDPAPVRICPCRHAISGLGL